MFKGISTAESEKFHPLQWVKVYGIVSSRCDYIITCQVEHLKTVLKGFQSGWWDEYILEPVDEDE